jgi:hypothetical protein
MFAASLWGGNSIFSYDGYPIQYYGRDVYSLGMGDTGSSDVFRYNTGYANPAQSNTDNKTLFGTGLIFGYTNYKSKYNNEEQSFRDDSLDFPYFTVSIPVKRHRFGFQFLSQANGVVKNQTRIDSLTIERQETDKYLYRADLIYSYRYKNLSLGLSGNYFLGHDNRVFEQTSSSNTVPTSESMKKNYKNPSLSFGAVQSYHDHAFGAYATLPVKLEGEKKWTSFINSGDTEDTSYELPLTIGMGYTGLIAPEIKVATDYVYETFAETDENLRDSWKAGFGIAYEPEVARKRHWYQKLPLRAGYSLRALPFKSENGEYVDENTFSAGFSFPLKGDINRIDLGFQYQTRGSLETNNLQDRSFMMLFGFTGFDIISRAPDRTAPREIPQAEDIQ